MYNFSNKRTPNGAIGTYIGSIQGTFCKNIDVVVI